MDDADRAQEIEERRRTPRGHYYWDRYPFTDLTPHAEKADDIKVGKRGSPNGVSVYYRCECGKLLNLGRPAHVAGASLDDCKFVECSSCGRGGES